MRSPKVMRAGTGNKKFSLCGLIKAFYNNVEGSKFFHIPREGVKKNSVALRGVFKVFVMLF